MRFISVGKVSAFAPANEDAVTKIARGALGPATFQVAQTEPVRVALPYKRLPYGVWVASGEAARLLRRPLRSVKHEAKRKRHCTARFEGSRQRLIFLVAVRPARRAKPRRKGGRR